MLRDQGLSLRFHWIVLPLEMKVSIVPAVTETNDYSSSVSLGTFGHTLYTCAAADEQSRLQFQSPYFSADVCNYSADLSNGSEAADHMTSPGPPSVSTETTAVIKSHSLATVRKP